MAHYPSQIIPTVCKAMPDSLKAYISKNVQEEDSFLFEQSLENCVESVLDGWYKDTSSPDISSIIISLQANRRQRRRRMYKRFIELTEYDDSDFRSPFNFLAAQRSSPDPSHWVRLYDQRTYEEVRQSYCDSMKEWSETPAESIFSCPFLGVCVNSRYMKDLFYDDLAYEIALFIRKKYAGDLRNYFRSYPSELIDKPLFAPNSYELLVRQIGHTLTNDIRIDNGGEGAIFRTIFNVAGMGDGGEPLLIKAHALDVRCQNVLSILLSNLTPDFYDTHTAVADASNVIRQFYNIDEPIRNSSSGLSSKYYKTLESICDALRTASFEVMNLDGTQLYFFNLFDTIGYENQGDRVVITAVLGTLLYRSIVDKRLVRVTADNYNALENKMSRILYYMIQRERIGLAKQALMKKEPITDGDMTKYYTPAYFRSVVRFRYKSSLKNMALIMEALDEFKNLEIAVKGYQKTKDGVYITYYPLSDEEIKDLTLQTNTLVPV